VIAALAIAMLAAPPAAAAPPPTVDDQDIVVEGRHYGPCGPRFATVYVAPMGEPFRTNGIADPMRHWFDQADADHDGRLTRPELIVDAQHFFATLDTDRDGELDPQEVSAYEIDVAPEIKLYQSDAGFFTRAHGRAAKHVARQDARARADYVTPYGAGTYASLNIPEPVASADLDIDRGVSRDEFAAVAAGRFALLDGAQRGYLTYDALARSPAQQAIDACYAKEAAKTRK
jgi:hypothetical protein